jgi:hypothetical protein
MERETILLLALGMLVAAALVVGVSGWVLLLRDRGRSKTTKTTLGQASAHVETAHHREAVEGS